MQEQIDYVLPEFSYSYQVECALSLLDEATI